MLPVGPARQETLASLHRELDQGAAQGLDLGCQYVDADRLTDLRALHPMWTHGSLVQRSLSGVLCGYWAQAARKPLWWLNTMTTSKIMATTQKIGAWAMPGSALRLRMAVTIGTGPMAGEG